MIVLRNSIIINAPLEKVFNFLAAPENFPKWNYYLKTVSKIGEGNPVIGSTYHQIRKADEQYFTISGFKENEYLEISSTKKSAITFKRKFSFSTTENGCCINDYFELAPRVPNFIGKWLSKKPQKAVGENLMKLKELFEKGATTLQDGRVVSL